MRLMLFLGAIFASGALFGAEQVLEYAYPAGGVPGDEFEIEVGGRFMPNSTLGTVSGTGVKLAYIGTVSRVVRNKRGQPVSINVPNCLRFKVVIDSDAEPGVRELRISTPYRVSEPVGFEVANSANEFVKPPTNRTDSVVHEVLELPTTLNGRVCNEHGDRYHFRSGAGRSLVAFVERGGLPPGAFVPAISFVDANGNACADVRLYEEFTAPVALFEVPQEGQYTLEVKAASGRPGPECVYRIKFGELPLITALSPATAQEGESLNVRLEGVNLAQQRKRLFTGGKNSRLCMQTLVEGAFFLPSLDFKLAGEANAPDFTAILTPASLNIPANGSEAVRVRVERFNGFEGEVRVGLNYPPLGIACEGGIIPAGANECMMTISTDGHRYPRVLYTLELVATAVIGGQPVTRGVTPVRELPDGTAGRVQEFTTLAARSNNYMGALRVQIDAGQTLTIPSNKPLPITLQCGNFTSYLNANYAPVVLYPEKGLTLNKSDEERSATQINLLLQADSSIIKSGTSGNLIIGWVTGQGAQRRVETTTQSVPFVVR